MLRFRRPNCLLARSEYGHDPNVARRRTVARVRVHLVDNPVARNHELPMARNFSAFGAEVWVLAQRPPGVAKPCPAFYRIWPGPWLQ